MAREKADYRANLELLRQMFPGQLAISIQQAADVLNRDRRTFLKDRAFPAQLIGRKYSVPLTALARYMS